MHFEIVGKQRAKLIEVDIQSLKLGQTELKPAISLRFRITFSNDKLHMLDASLLPFLYEKNSAAQTQGALDGIPVVSDMPQLTPAARRLGTFGWEDEQTGCSLLVYRGVTGDMDVKLRDGTRTIKTVSPKEGGTVDIVFDFRATDLDAETMGELAVLKNHEPDIELTAPEIVSRQPDLQEEEQEQEEQVTPEKALATALQQQHDGKEVTAKPPARKTPVAKKIARHSAKQSRRGAKA